MEKCNIEAMSKSVERIEKALLGDEFNKNGLVQRMEKAESKIILHDRYFWLAIGAGALIVFVSGFISSCK